MLTAKTRLAKDSFVVGFTATRRELSDAERYWVFVVLREYHRPGAQFHHGDCLGGDQFGFTVANELGYVTVAHPPIDSTLRAFTESDVVMPPLPKLDRNQQIVLRSNVLVAVPACAERARGSGTWHTVRYARDVVKGRVIRNWWLERDVFTRLIYDKVRDHD